VFDGSWHGFIVDAIIELKYALDFVHVDDSQWVQPRGEEVVYA
jgi:hypothetical protein